MMTMKMMIMSLNNIVEYASTLSWVRITSCLKICEVGIVMEKVC